MDDCRYSHYFVVPFAVELVAPGAGPAQLLLPAVYPPRRPPGGSACRLRSSGLGRDHQHAALEREVIDRLSLQVLGQLWLWSLR